MLTKPDTCRTCPLDKLGTGFSYSIGTGKVAILGEALGKYESFKGEPFVGQSGKLLDYIIELIGCTRSDFVIDNVIRCRPPNNWLVGAPWEHGAIAHCRQYHQGTIRQTDPRVILTLGNVPTREILHVDDKISSIRGYVYERDGRFVIPTFHPAHLLPGRGMRGRQSLTGVVALDIKKAVRIAVGGYKRDDENFYCDPTGSDFCFLADKIVKASRISVDIETYGKEKDDIDEEENEQAEIARIGFAWENYAVSVPFTSDYLVDIGRVLCADNEKIFWLAEFDVPRIKKAGFAIHGRIIDAKRAWQFLQPGLPKEDKPNRLSFVAPLYCNVSPWKHLSHEQPAYYNAKDNAVTLRIMNGIEADLRSRGMWDAFITDVVTLLPVLERIGNNGLPVSIERQDEVRNYLTYIETGAMLLLQEEVPSELRLPHPKNGYVRAPKNTDSMVQRKFKDKKGNTVERWCKLRPFLPNSQKQVTAYLLAKGYQIPKDSRTGKATTGAKGIRSLARRYKDRVLEAVLNFRKAHKITGTYLWPIDPDGRVRTHFDFTYTGRLRSFNVNLQNMPKPREGDDDKLAALMRSTIVAPSGYTLIEADYSSAEPVMLGHYADDPDFIKAARLGIHTVFASVILGQPLDVMVATKLDVDVVKKEAKAKTIGQESVYNIAKKCVMGLLYKMGPRLMQSMYPEAFPHIKDAEKMQTLLYDTVAKNIKKWQDDIIMKVAREHWIQSPFGHGLWLWNVLAYNSLKKQWELGEDAKKAVAFLPQHSVGIKTRRDMLALKNMAYDGRLILQIHDSLWFLAENRKVEETVHDVTEVMTAPIPELGGLSLDIEVVMGISGEMMK